MSNKLFNGTLIEDTVKIGTNVHIGFGSAITGNVTIGNNVDIGCNTTIGGVGFAFDRGKRPMVRENMCGAIIIEDNVEIGNNCNIDCARVNTIIKNGAKIDSLCHIAHDVCYR